MDILTTVMRLMIGYGTLALILWAFLSAARFTPLEYRAIDKMPRLFWLSALGFAAVLLLWLGSFRPDEPIGPRTFTWIACLLLVGIYFYDIRPKLLNARAEQSDPPGRGRPRR